MYDIVIIGGGPAGYHSAEYAAANGLSVALFEFDKLGGTCLNRGCIPTKSLLHSAKGFTCGGKEKFDQPAALAEKDKVVSILVGGVSSGLKRKKISVFNGRAGVSRKGDHFQVAGGSDSVETKNVLIASGSVPVIPEIDGLKAGLEEGSALTSDGILSINEIPGELLVIGGGVVGFEMASYFNAAGSKVSVVEMSDTILGGCDQDVSAAYIKSMEELGISVYTGCVVKKLLGGRAVCEVKGGKPLELSYDRALVCVGRRANTDIEGLKELGVEIRGGTVTADGKCRTNVAGIYAAGDVLRTPALASVALREGEVAVNAILGKNDGINYDSVCTTVFTQPEAAFIGLSEAQARAGGYSVAVKKQSINFSGRSVAENGMSQGLCKLVIDKKKNTIIGASLVSSYATEIAAFLVLVIQNQIPVPSILRTVFPHPTVAEIIRDVLES